MNLILKISLSFLKHNYFKYKIFHKYMILSFAKCLIITANFFSLSSAIYISVELESSYRKPIFPKIVLQTFCTTEFLRGNTNVVYLIFIVNVLTYPITWDCFNEWISQLKAIFPQTITFFPTSFIQKISLANAENSPNWSLFELTGWVDNAVY